MRGQGGGMKYEEQGGGMEGISVTGSELRGKGRSGEIQGQ